jgi:hypothetical protein
MDLDPINYEKMVIKGKDYDLFKMDLIPVIRFLKESDAADSNESIVNELWVTLLFALLLRKGKKPINAIGFPCQKEFKDSEFEARIKNLKTIAVERSEFDTVIFYSLYDDKTEYYRIQIVQYVRQDYKDIESLYRFLVEKKLKKYQKDEKLFLIINIKEPIYFEYGKLNEMLASSEVPFGNIFAIGHTGETEGNQYFGVKIFPKIEGHVLIDLGKEPL